MIDPRARRILFAAYWSAKGWKVPREEPSPADLAYAESAGVMFKPESLTHDAAVARILAARSLTDGAAVADAFVASLSSRQLYLRPALASYFMVQHVLPHAFAGSPTCATCGLFPCSDFDFSATNFARLKWGAVPRYYALDHAFILERFSVEARPQPTSEDRLVLHQLLTVADSLENGARARDLEKAWAPLIASSRAERDVLIEVLAACGVLSPARTSASDIASIPTRSNWSDLAALWRGEDRVNRERAGQLFAWKPPQAS